MSDTQIFLRTGETARQKFEEERTKHNRISKRQTKTQMVIFCSSVSKFDLIAVTFDGYMTGKCF